MTRVVADLHIHTTRSDGAVDPAALPGIAKQRRLNAVAITDHDRLPPSSVPIRSIDGVTLISGIELRVDAGTAGRLDLLCYSISPTNALERLTKRLQEDRIDRANAMVERLESELDVSLAIGYNPGVGRPHIAAAVAAVTELSPQEVFDHYIGSEGPCFVPREVPSFETGVRLLREAGGLVILAHPLRYRDSVGALDLVDRLDGVEMHYPYQEPIDTSPLESLPTHDRLVVTGGSDAHTLEDIGSCGLDEAAYKAFASHLDLSMD